LGELINDWRKHPGWYTQSISNKLFLLSSEDAYFGMDPTASSKYSTGDNYPFGSMNSYFQTTGTGDMRTSGYHVLFADGYAIGTTDLSGSTVSSKWWLRSPESDLPSSTVAYASSGGLSNGQGITTSCGIRPACWVNLGP